MEEKKELLDRDERVVEIELERLRGFVNHPFKVQADSQMIELQESIKKYGILNPLIQRKRLLKNISVVRRIWLILQRSRESLMNPHSRRSIRSVPE